MDCSIPGLPVHHQLPDFTQTHVHWVSDAIQPFHPLSYPSPSTFNHSQHQGLFKWVSSAHQVAKVLEFQVQNQCFQWIFRTDFLKDWLVWSPCSLHEVYSEKATLELAFCGSWFFWMTKEVWCWVWLKFLNILVLRWKIRHFPVQWCTWIGNLSTWVFW